MKRIALSLALAAVLAFAFASDADARGYHSSRARTRISPITSGTLIKIQDKLETLGIHAGPRDGLMGPQVRAAIRLFQARNHMVPTGILNEQTVAMLTEPQMDSSYAVPVAGPGQMASPIAYFANPWQNKPKYTVPGMAIGASR